MFNDKRGMDINPLAAWYSWIPGEWLVFIPSLWTKENPNNPAEGVVPFVPSPDLKPVSCSKGSCCTHLHWRIWAADTPYGFSRGSH